jgi:hypothetical protein
VVVSYPGVDKSALERCLQSTAVRSASLEQAAPPAPAPPRTGTGVGVLAYEKQSAARLAWSRTDRYVDLTPLTKDVEPSNIL